MADPAGTGYPLGATKSATGGTRLHRMSIVRLPGVSTAEECRLEQALSDQGLATVVGLDEAGPGDMVVVLLPEGDWVGPEPVELEQLHRRDDLLIPVVLGSRPSSLLADRSQIVRPPGAEDDVARRLASLLVLGGASLVHVNELAASARRWEEHGARDFDLLDQAGTAAAPMLVATARQAGRSDIDLLARFVRRSLVRQARLHRRRLLITSTVVLALILVATVSVVQKNRADAAAADATAKAALARSQRLSTLADGMLATNPDPDVTWALAQASLDADVNTGSVHTAQLVRQAIPAHRSFALPQTPRTLAGSDAGLLAVGYADGSAEVRRINGEVVRRVAAASGTRALALSADGTHLALLGERVTVNHSVGFPDADDLSLSPPSTVVSATWVGSSLWLLTGSGVITVDGDRFSPALPGLPSWLGALTQLDVTPDGQRAVVTGSSGAAVIDTASGQTVRTYRDATLRQSVLASDGKTVYLRHVSGLVERDELTESYKPYGRRAAFSIFRAGDLILAGVQGGLCPIVPPGPGAARCVVVHRGSVEGAVGLGSDGFGTVGTDRYLRIWPSLDAPRFGSRNADGSSSVELSLPTDQDRTARRSQVEADPSAGTICVLSRTMGNLGRLTSQLEPIWSAGGGDEDLSTDTLAPLGNFASHRQGRYATVFALGDATHSGSLVWKSSAGSSGLKPIDSLSADGRVLVSVTSTRALVWRDGAVILDRATGKPPVAVVVDPNDNAAIFFADGTRLAADGSESPGIGEPILAVSAVTVDGRTHLAWVTASHRLLESVGAAVRQVTVLPENLPVYALKYAADASYLAIFADRESQVLRLDDGAVLYAIRSATEAATVQDVAFLADRIVTVDHWGGLRAGRLMEPASLAAYLSTGSPRPLSEGEQADYQLIDPVK